MGCGSRSWWLRRPADFVDTGPGQAFRGRAGATHLRGAADVIVGAARFHYKLRAGPVERVRKNCQLGRAIEVRNTVDEGVAPDHTTLEAGVCIDRKSVA